MVFYLLSGKRGKRIIGFLSRVSARVSNEIHARVFPRCSFSFRSASSHPFDSLRRVCQQSSKNSPRQRLQPRNIAVGWLYRYVTFRSECCSLFIRRGNVSPTGDMMEWRGSYRREYVVVGLTNVRKMGFVSKYRGIYAALACVSSTRDDLCFRKVVSACRNTVHENFKLGYKILDACVHGVLVIVVQLSKK